MSLEPEACEDGVWVSAGHRRRLEIHLPPESAADRASITLDGVPQTHITRIEFAMRPNALVTVRMERIGQPSQLSDTGEIVVDTYLYESRLGRPDLYASEDVDALHLLLSAAEDPSAWFGATLPEERDRVVGRVRALAARMATALPERGGDT